MHRRRPWFIVDAAPESARLIRTAREVNDAKPHYVLDRVKQAARRFKEPVIACFGLSFKANIDDLRESPAIEIVQTMVQQQLGTVLVVEPHIKVLPAALQGVELLNAEAALSRADIVVLLVDHQQFRKLDTDRLQSRVVIDTRGMWSAKRIAA